MWLVGGCPANIGTTYIICGVDGRERALESVHFLASNVCLAEVSAEEIIVSVFNGCYSVITGTKLGGIIAEEGSFAFEEIVGIIGVAYQIEVGCWTTRFRVSWPSQYKVSPGLGFNS